MKTVEIVKVHGVDEVVIVPPGVRVVCKDYDCDLDSPDIKYDEDGDPYTERIFEEGLN